MELRAKVHIDVESQIEEALDIAVVQWLDAQGVRPRLQSRNDETTVLVQREPADQLAFAKTLRSGVRLAVLDTVPIPWRPLRIHGDTLTVRHAIGSVQPEQLEWLTTVKGDGALVLLIHHYPLEAPEFRWNPTSRLRHFLREVRVPMTIPAEEREQFWAAASASGARLVLCGHVHRARLEWKDGIAVGLNGQSGAEWAGRTIASYDLARQPLKQVCE